MTFIKINIKPYFFHEQKEVLLTQGVFRATTFRYHSGVCGLEISNSICSMDILPYQGQQVWNASFYKKNLTMKSIFNEPQATTVYGHNYGAHLIHCGATAMGNPSAEDTHPLHGELPNAAYQDAYVGIGEDEKGRYIAVGGSFTYRNALKYHYTAEPELRLYENQTIAEVTMTISNKRCYSMEYMYMCHINWLPIDGSRLVYSAPKDKEHITVYMDDFWLPEERERARKEYTKKLIENPIIGDVLDSKTQVYEPEICSCITYKADKNGYAHAMQVMPDKDACYVSFQTKHLPNGLRWIARTGDEDAVGFALPTTGNHLGYAYAKRNGLMKSIPPNDSITLRLIFGYLNQEQTKQMEEKIQDILS